jgi:transposase-like protein
MFAMPWKESRVVDERVKSVAEMLEGERKIKKLCQQYGISRKTGYKWIRTIRGSRTAALYEWRVTRPERSPVLVPPYYKPNFRRADYPDTSQNAQQV